MPQSPSLKAARRVLEVTAAVVARKFARDRLNEMFATIDIIQDELERQASKSGRPLLKLLSREDK